MLELTEHQKQQLKLIQLDILDEIHRICMAHGLRYTLAFGTMIGAVRHGGFIPWDDDLDLLMPRADLEKFMEIAPRELNSKFYLVSNRTHPAYAHTFPKVMARNTVMKEESISTNNAPDGVFVDLFPFDASPNEEALKIRQNAKAQRIMRILLCKGNYYFGQKGLRLLIYRLRKLLYLVYPREKLVRQYEEVVRAYENDPTCRQVVSIFIGDDWRRLTVDKELIEHYIPWEFEGHPSMIAAGYHEILTVTFGDYMQLPPVEEQVGHHFVTELDLDSYFAQ